MSFSEFIAECNANEKINISHAICSSKDAILSEYVKPPYKMDSLKLFFSMTKSFSSLAIGIAIDLGLLNIDDTIIKFFNDEIPPITHKNLEKITIYHLLTMSSGIHDNTYAELFVKNNWVSAFLEQKFQHEPGTYYRYSTHSSHMLSAIITKVTSLSLEDFLNKYLFYPMGIYEAQWEQSPENLTAGGMGLSLYPHSLVKVSQLLLNHGIYNGKSLISKEYLDTATKQHIIKQDDIEIPDNDFCGMGYGFQFHICKDEFYRLDGAFGQLCLICPSKNISVIIFSQYSKMEVLLSIIYKHLLISNCTWDIYSEHTIKSTTETNGIFNIPFNKYQLYKNELGIKSVEFSINQEDYRLTVNYDDYVNIIDFSFSHITEGKITFIKDLQNHVQKYVCLTTFEDSVTLKLFLIETPYIVTYSFTFLENEVKLDFSINVSFNMKNQTIIGSTC